MVEATFGPMQLELKSALKHRTCLDLGDAEKLQCLWTTVEVNLEGSNSVESKIEALMEVCEL